MWTISRFIRGSLVVAGVARATPGASVPTASTSWPGSVPVNGGPAIANVGN